MIQLIGIAMKMKATKADFDATMALLLTVPKTTIVKKQKAWRKKVDANPNRRGPKRKSEIASGPPKFDD